MTANERRILRKCQRALRNDNATPALREECARGIDRILWRETATWILLGSIGFFAMLFVLIRAVKGAL